MSALENRTAAQPQQPRRARTSAAARTTPEIREQRHTIPPILEAEEAEYARLAGERADATNPVKATRAKIKHHYAEARRWEKAGFEAEEFIDELEEDFFDLNDVLGRLKTLREIKMTGFSNDGLKSFADPVFRTRTSDLSAIEDYIVEVKALRTNAKIAFQEAELQWSYARLYETELEKLLAAAPSKAKP